MENADLDKLCRQIHINHRQALDLIWERVGSPSSGLVGRIQQWIEERPGDWLHITTKQKEVEFIPAVWNKMLPPVGKRKTFEPEHWMTMRLRAYSKHLRLFVIVCPTTDAAVRKSVLERLLKDKNEFGFSTFFKKKELTKDWTKVLSERCALSEDLEEPEKIDAVMDRVEKRLENFLKQTAGLPAAMETFLPI